MNSGSQTVTYLKDYEPPVFLLDAVDLHFDIFENKTIVSSVIKVRKNPLYSKSSNMQQPLVLDGKNLILLSVQIDEKILLSTGYELTPEQLIISEVPEKFVLKIKNEICPEKNTELAGLFRSKSMYCTQCESQGFRRITYFFDRPDVMAKFTTTIVADKTSCPVLLSNGNCIEKGNIDQNRHWVKWEDPFLKPAYLFALVAGDLVSLEDYFVTMSQRLVTLKIFVERENQDKCQHAMLALKKSMKWDEETYGREYDLDIYMIVAVNDFNMGAMENKGLNIFNSKYILARPETATDIDYQYIDAVVGHEYFHNWSGNRVTCRDWFQLSLKEGLTVFREHQFSADITQSPVSLIENVRHLRSQQFAEDQSPMAHPVRPESYMEINNFYTMTVYEKGAEVIRMIKILLGRDNFRKGMDLYFKRHDGEAVTCEDFVVAMEDASGVDLKQFRLWYSQAGTPEVTVQENYNVGHQSYQLTLKQSCPPTPNQPEKKPMVIPIMMGLLNKKGEDILPQGEILVLKEDKQTFTFQDINEPPVLSILRQFSAPVKVNFERSEDTLSFLLAKDSDPVSRWDAGQKLTEQLIWRLTEDLDANRPLRAPSYWLDAYFAILQDQTLPKAFKAELLTLPAISELLQSRSGVDIDVLYTARNFLKKSLVESLKEPLLETYHSHHTTDRYIYSSENAASRRLKNLCLGYLLTTQEKTYLSLALQQWKNANNMTDSLGVLSALSQWEGPEREAVLSQFYDKWQHDPLVLDKWFRIQAATELPNTLEVVKRLWVHPAFDIKNPNKVYSLIGAFTNNVVSFNEASGEGYEFLADVVLKLDQLNPQVASRMVRAFSSWQRVDAKRQMKIKDQLNRILKQNALSKDVFEVVSKCLVVGD